VDDLELLTSMLRIQSLSGQEGALAHFLVDQFRERGFRGYVDAAGNAIGERGDASRGPTIVLLGHMDTVPGDIHVRREDDRLYGRGAVDAKGPLAAFIAAASTFDGPGRVIVIGAVEEEVATSKGARVAASAFAPDCAIIGEPSAWDRITVGYKGRLLAGYTVSRETAHTASGQQNACEAAVEFWQAVMDATTEANADRPPGAFERLSPSLRAMSSAGDGMRDIATMQLGFRLPPGFSADQWRATVIRLAGDAHVEYSSYEPAVRVPKNTTVARAFIRAIRAAGGDPRFVVKTGTSDLNVVSERWNCPMLAYGPGDSLLDHTPREHIDVREYQSAIKVLRTVLAELSAST
jgi:[amino group carrier protein]-lysine/ornithine hydrolase